MSDNKTLGKKDYRAARERPNIKSITNCATEIKNVY